MASDVRARNLQIARRLGHPTPPDDLPYPGGTVVRSTDEAVDRALAVNVVLSCAHGLPADAALAWLDGHGLGGVLSPHEQEYLEDVADGMRLGGAQRKLHVEALWALLWAVSLADELDFASGCGERVTPLVPDLFDPLEGPGAARVRAEAELRPADDVRAALDLARCLAWGLGVADLSVAFSPGEVEPYVVWERRRALEWLLGADWDEPY
jgi:hypothetical protein